MDSDLWQLIQHNTCQKTVDGNGQKLEKRQKPNFPQNQLFVNQHTNCESDTFNPRKFKNNIN